MITFRKERVAMTSLAGALHLEQAFTVLHSSPSFNMLQLQGEMYMYLINTII